MTSAPPGLERSIAIVGAGPRGVGVLERLIANHAVLAPDLPLTVHVIDPHPPGAGRVWRVDQSPLLRLNSMAADIAVFTDPTVACEGPIVPGEYVLIHSGFALERMSPERAADAMAFFGADL